MDKTRKGRIHEPGQGMWEVGRRSALAQNTQRGRGERQEQYEKGAKNMVGLRTRQGEVAACTLVSAVSTGNWGRGGRRSQGPPECEIKISKRRKIFKLISDTITIPSSEFTEHQHNAHYNYY